MVRMLIAVVLILTGSMNTVRLDSVEDGSESDEGANFKDEQNSESNVTCPGIPGSWNRTLPHPTISSHYYRCQNGVLSLLHCETGHTFDPDKSECTETSKKSFESSEAVSDFCQKQVDGLYPNHTHNCQHYFRCQSGHTVSVHSCPSGQSFSFHEQICLSSTSVSCVSPVCHREEDDFFWLPGSLCRAYYYCQSGTALKFICPRGKQFSKETKDCVTGEQCYEPICTGKPDGNHSDTTHECKRFLQCKGGVLETVTSCPSGQLHNGRHCLPAALVRCERPEVTAVTVEDVHDDCRGYSNGAHVLPATDCHRYQICQDGKALARLSCPRGTRFNGNNCTPQDSTSCEELCDGKPDGYHADGTEGCRKYHFCREGKTTERRSCPDGSLFSGHMCLPSSFVSCEENHSTEPNNPCLGLADGYHADYLHGCLQYFYCSGYSVVERTWCPKHMMWNGKLCLPANQVLCQGPEPKEECHGIATGLYQDKASGCAKYYFCHGGKRTLLACPKGQLFDGLACVSEKEYVCPSMEPATCYNQTDGYRVDKESGCRAYYYCSNGYKSTYVCPSGQLFNGTVCERAYTCPYMVNPCKEKSNGYHSDFRTRCRKYHYCQDGTKLNTLSCGPRKIFNGVRCVFTTDLDSNFVCTNAAFPVFK